MELSSLKIDKGMRQDEFFKGNKTLMSKSKKVYFLHQLFHKRKELPVREGANFKFKKFEVFFCDKV